MIDEKVVYIICKYYNLKNVKRYYKIMNFMLSYKYKKF